LHWAAIAGHVDVIKFLTSNGADIAAVTKTKMNILHAGVEANKPDVVKFIFQFTADKEDVKLVMCNTKNSDDKFPAEIAIGMKSKELVQILKDGGDPNAASASCIIM